MKRLIRIILGMLIMAISGGVIYAWWFDKKVADATILSLKSQADRQTAYYNLLSAWILNYDNIRIESYLKPESVNLTSNI